MFALTLFFLGCSHPDSFPIVAPTVGPFGSASDVQLTFNPEQDYWPTWSQDGRSILYAYVQQGGNPQHRCMGILPAAGGTRIWEMCDNRAVEKDSTNSFIAYALSSSGQLLYVTAVSDTGFAPRALSKRITFWLADTATPYQRTALISLKYTIDNTGTLWYSDIAWTGPNTFVALEQGMAIPGIPPKGCDIVRDSIFGAGQVVSGTIANGKATLQGIAGTNGAAAYSLAEGGASIVFTRAGSGARLYRVPIAGGTANPVSGIIGDNAMPVGVGCRGSACVVAADNLVLDGAPPPFCADPPVSGTQTLFGVDLTTGTVQPLLTNTLVLATPVVSLATGNVVLQIGGGFGHLQSTTKSPNGDLHLLSGLFH